MFRLASMSRSTSSAAPRTAGSGLTASRASGAYARSSAAAQSARSLKTGKQRHGGNPSTSASRSTSSVARSRRERESATLISVSTTATSGSSGPVKSGTRSSNVVAPGAADTQPNVGIPNAALVAGPGSAAETRPPSTAGPGTRRPREAQIGRRHRELIALKDALEPPDRLKAILAQGHVGLGAFDHRHAADAGHAGHHHQVRLAHARFEMPAFEPLVSWADAPRQAKTTASTIATRLVAMT